MISIQTEKLVKKANSEKINLNFSEKNAIFKFILIDRAYPVRPNGARGAAG